MLRNAETADTEITDEFIDKFAVVLGSRWPLLASLLSFTTDEIWQITNNVIGKPSVKAAAMMKWRGKASATFGILTGKVKHGYLYIVGFVLYYCFFLCAVNCCANGSERIVSLFSAPHACSLSIIIQSVICLCTISCRPLVTRGRHK